MKTTKNCLRIPLPPPATAVSFPLPFTQELFLQAVFSLPPSILLENPPNRALVPLPTDPPEPSCWGSSDVQSLDTVRGLCSVLLVSPAGFVPAAHSLFSDAPSSLGCPNTTLAWFSSSSLVTPILLCSSPQLLNVTPTCSSYLLRTPGSLALFRSSQICVLETSLISLHPTSLSSFPRVVILPLPLS